MSINILMTSSLLSLASLAAFPIGAHLLNLLLVVEFGVVVLADTSETLIQGQVLRMHGNTMVIMLPTSADKLPAAFLLLEIKTGGLRQEKESKNHTSKSEPWHCPEDLWNSDIVVKDSGGQSTELTGSGGETVSGGTDGCWVDLGGDKEGDGVGTELVKEGGEKVHGLELLDVGVGGVILVLEGRNDEKDEVQKESNLLHILATIELVINQES